MNNWTRPNRRDLDATKTPSACDIAWAAGVYEGEGSCRLCGRTKRGFAVSVAQKDPELLYWLRDWLGGSVNPPSGGNNCYHLDLCGDRARLFIAQIYGRLTSRRKAQADETGCLDFLRGESPERLSSEELKARLLSYYEEERDRRISPVAKKRRAQRAEYYQRKAQDPAWVAAKNERERARDQKKQGLKVVRISETA